jgi:hypothetical protein
MLPVHLNAWAVSWRGNGGAYRGCSRALVGPTVAVLRGAPAQCTVHKAGVWGSRTQTDTLMLSRHALISTCSLT